MSSLKLWLLGPPRIEVESAPVQIQRRKAIALLVYLAVTGESQPRDHLATLLWPESDQSSARMALRRDLSALHKALGRAWLEIDRERVGLEHKPGPSSGSGQALWLDVAHFQSLLAACRSHGHPASEVCPTCLPLLAEAAELYRADFLTGFTLPDCPEFDEWQFFQTESLRRELASVLERLARSYEVQGEAEREAALAYARRWLALDPLHEPAHRQLMQLYAEVGQQAAALRQYQECVRLLDEELGVSPAAETIELYETIKARRGSSLQSSRGAEGQGGNVDLRSQAKPPFWEAPLLPRPPAPFVAREGELAQLDAFLNRALAGRGQAVFVIGEAGRGKTALVQEFTRQAQTRQADLITAGGNCNAYTGLGDPYLPFREILGLLTGEVEGRWAAGAMSQAQAQRLWAFTPHSVQALVNSGPDLIDTFIPGAALLARATAVASGSLPGSGHSDTAWLVQLKELTARHAASQSPATVQQSDLFEQFAKVIQAAARRQPLLLVVDDLQWADGGSINLLFHLGRRLEGSRVLMVGIYRPAEVALGRPSSSSGYGERHPLEALVHEFQRQLGDILIDLGQAEGRQFVNDFLETEPNRLGPEFREALYQHTRGHALFTVEMVRGMQERGDLVRDAQGRWVAGPALNWEILPARIEGVIGERIGRLPAKLQEALKIASIEGERFTAEVVARLLAVDERLMVRQLSGELDQQHRLVNGQGGQRLGSGGQRLSHYRFRHILFQRYLYHSLAEAERVYLHEAVGHELERLYGEQTEPVAVELARHFEAAGLTARAVDYLHQAGSRAVSLSANEEALGHLKRGLTLLKTLPETLERNRQELALQIASFAPLMAVKGYGAPDLGQAYDRARVLCEKVMEPTQLFVVLYGLWGYSLVRMDLRMTGELAQQCLTLAESSQNRALLLEGHRMVGETAFYRGDFIPARQHLEQSYNLYDPQLHHAHASVYGQDPKVALLSNGSWNLWCLGYPDQALKWSQEALALAQEWPHPFSQAFALDYACVLHQFRGEGQAVQQQVEAAATLSAKQGFALWLAMANILQGWMLVEQGEIEKGLAQMRQGLVTQETTGVKLQAPYFLTLIAKAYEQIGQVRVALDLLAEAIASVEKTVGHYWEAELYRLKGELLLKDREAGGRRKDEAEKCFWRAMEVARRQGAKSLELRAVMSLSRLWQAQGSQGKREEARQMLAEIYGWFTEGFDTADLQEARVLLETLSAEIPEHHRPELAQHGATALPARREDDRPTSPEQPLTQHRTLYRQLSPTPAPPAQAGSGEDHTLQLFQVLYGQWAFKQVRAELQPALNLAEQMLHLAQRQPDPFLLMPAYWTVGNIHYWMGQFAAAQSYLEQSLALYDPQHHRAHVLLFGQDQGVACLSFQGWNLWCLGYPDQAWQKSRAALTLAHELGHPYSQVYAINWAAQVHLKRREWQAGLEHIDAELALSIEHGFSFWQVVATILRGWALTEQGQVAEAIPLLRQGVDNWRALGAEVSRPYFLAPLIAASGRMGQVEEGLKAVTEALAAVEKTAEHLWEAELYRLRGELLLKDREAGGGRKDEVEVCFWQAIEVARRQEAKSLELRAVMSLSRLWQGQGRREEARRMLAEIYGWFTEGFETADLQEAKVLLDGLSTDTRL